MAKRLPKAVQNKIEQAFERFESDEFNDIDKIQAYLSDFALNAYNKAASKEKEAITLDLFRRTGGSEWWIEDGHIWYYGSLSQESIVGDFHRPNVAKFVNFIRLQPLPSINAKTFVREEAESLDLALKSKKLLPYNSLQIATERVFRNAEYEGTIAAANQFLGFLESFNWELQELAPFVMDRHQTAVETLKEWIFQRMEPRNYKRA